MTVLTLPVRGRWVWDARDRTRAVRVAAHPEAGLLNLSVWRDEICVGTVKLEPDEVVSLVQGLTDGLARLAESAAPAPDDRDARLAALEERLAGVETRLAPPRRAFVATLAARGRAIVATVARPGR
jgi:predicted RNA-binding Zn ribbon-like protein